MQLHQLHNACALKPYDACWCRLCCCGCFGALQDAATPGPTCTTASDGSCVIDLVAAKVQQLKAASNAAFQPLEESGAYTAVITAEGHGPLVVPEVPNSGRFRNGRAGKEYVATLVLDRKLVKPGDDLHVTGVWCVSSSRCARANVGVFRSTSSSETYNTTLLSYLT